jgi:hypothetical protein
MRLAKTLNRLLLKKMMKRFMMIIEWFWLKCHLKVKLNKIILDCISILWLFIRLKRTPITITIALMIIITVKTNNNNNTNTNTKINNNNNNNNNNTNIKKRQCGLNQPKCD